MGIENKHFRCHGSIVLEECAKVILSIGAIILLNISDINIEDIENMRDDLIVPLVIAGGLLIGLLVFLILSVIRWKKTTIIIENDGIVWERNTLNKKKLTISIKSISSINLERNMFERIIGTAKLKLDTNSLSTANETDVQLVFKYDDAVNYKNYLEAKVKELNADSLPEDEEIIKPDITNPYDIMSNFKSESKATKERVVAEYVSDSVDLLKHCIYELPIGGLLLTCLMVLVNIMEMIDALRNGINGIGDLLGYGIMIISFGYMAVNLVFGKLFRFYNLTISRTGNRIHMKYGMFKLKEYIIPVEKINAIHIKQGFIGRMFKKYSVSMECVGVGDEENETAQLTLSLSFEEFAERLSEILPEYDVKQLETMDKIDKKSIYHKLKRVVFFTVTVIGFIIGMSFAREAMGEVSHRSIILGIAIGVIILIYVIIIGEILLQQKIEAVGFGEKHMVISTGAVARDIMMVSYKKIQCVTTSSSILSRYTGLVSGNIRILAGVLQTTKKLPLTKEDKIDYLKEKLCER